MLFVFVRMLSVGDTWEKHDDVFVWRVSGIEECPEDSERVGETHGRRQRRDTIEED